jgi:hypothetical protein
VADIQYRGPNVEVRVQPAVAIPSGAAVALGHVHTQSTPSTLWAITHSLPFRPNVSVVDSAGNVVVVDVQHMSPTLIHVKPASAFAGTAYLS